VCVLVRRRGSEPGREEDRQRASAEDPKMKIHRSEDPYASYLMHKLDGDQGDLAGQGSTTKTMRTNCEMIPIGARAPLAVVDPRDHPDVDRPGGAEP
jgi:hypothetical protein